MSIPLGPLSRTDSSCLPGSRNRAGRASWLPYLALHRIRHSRQALSPRLPVVSYTTISPLPGTEKAAVSQRQPKRSAPGGLFLWSCSALLRLPVRKYPALWCPDFPLLRNRSSGHLVFPWVCKQCMRQRENSQGKNSPTSKPPLWRGCGLYTALVQIEWARLPSSQRRGLHGRAKRCRLTVKALSGVPDAPPA